MFKELTPKDNVCTRIFPFEAVKALREKEGLGSFTPVPIWYQTPEHTLDHRNDVLAYRRWDGFFLSGRRDRLRVGNLQVVL